MKRRAFLYLGSAFIGVGALHQSSAFSSAVANRGIGISTAADKHGLLGIDGNDDPSITPTITNNSSTYSMDVTLDSEGVDFDPESFDLEPGEDEEVELFGDDDMATITAEFKANGTDAGSIVLERFFDVPLIASIRDVEGSYEGVGGSGQYNFQLINRGDDPVTVDGFGVEWTNNEDVIGIDDTIEHDGTPIIEQFIPIDGQVYDTDEVTLNPDDGENFRISRFSHDAPAHPDVADVDLVIRAAEDGSTTTVELRSTD